MGLNCRCKECKTSEKLNFNESIFFMANDHQSPYIASQSFVDGLAKILALLFYLFVYLGPFLLGIIVGMAIVLQNPPKIDNKNKDEKIHWKLDKNKIDNNQKSEKEIDKKDAPRIKSSYTLQ